MVSTVRLMETCYPHNEAAQTLSWSLCVGEIREGVCPLVIKDERRLDVTDIGEAQRQDELLQVGGVAGHKVDDKIVLAGDMVMREHLWNFVDALEEADHVIGGVPIQLHKDHGLKVDSHCLWGDLRMNSPQMPTESQFFHAINAR